MKFFGTVALCACAFVWGALAYRGNLFPYPQLRSAAVALGALDLGREEAAPRGGRSARKRLETLGYLQSAPVEADAAESGVVLANRQLSFDGLNLYKETGVSTAHLIDNAGVEVYSWTMDQGRWIHAELSPDDGALIGVSEEGFVFRLSADSRLEWKTPARAHHDLQVRSDGSIWALTRRDSRWPERYGDQPIVEDTITVLSPQGELLREISLLEPFRGSPYEYLLPAAEPSTGQGKAYELLHANHVEVFDGTLAHRSALFREGNLLVSFRTLNAVAILEKDSGRILWLWGPTNLSVQHHPSLLDNGNLLIFDNGYDESRVIEVAVPEGRIVWEYSAGPSFFSVWGGSVQRLPNGNTLITSSAQGSVFEVTPQGQTVWKFVNPRPVDDGGSATSRPSRWNIWRMTRFPRSALKFLDR
ncbi:MAG: hypothetical protein GC160_16980 [Acidobacteria bacterium]|nr:hypothetical protein [Acidobacteriota bacterium]